MDAKRFRDRASSLYTGQRDRAKKFLLKTVPRGVKIELAAEESLPYTRHQLYAWLWERVGLGVIQCPYCRGFIDINSLVIDHKVPLALGGALGLENQEPTCARCNGLKGELLPEEFRSVLAFLDTQSPHLRAHLEACLLNGPRMRRFFPKKTATGDIVWGPLSEFADFRPLVLWAR